MDNRSKLKQAALKLFVEKGFQGTSTASISKEASVATGTLFNYFATKDELLDQLYIESRTEMADWVLPGITDEIVVDEEEQIYLLWEGCIEWCLANPLNFKFIEIYSRSSFVSRVARQEADSSFAALVNVTKSAIEEVNASQLPTGLIYQVFFAQMSAVVTYLLDKSELSSAEKREIIESGFQFFWSAIQ